MLNFLSNLAILSRSCLSFSILTLNFFGLTFLLGLPLIFSNFLPYLSAYSSINPFSAFQHSFYLCLGIEQEIQSLGFYSCGYWSTWLLLFDKCHLNRVSNSSHVDPIYVRSLLKATLYILPLNLRLVNSKSGWCLFSYLLFSSFWLII